MRLPTPNDPLMTEAFRQIQAEDEKNVKIDRSTRFPDDVYQAAILYDNGGAVFNVQHPEFGAVGDGSTDDTAAIQAALDAAGLEGTTTQIGPRHQQATVLLPAGIYQASQLVIPYGVTLTGVGSTAVGDRFGSLIRQISGTDDDLIRFVGNVSDNVNHVEISRLALLGNEGDTAGSAIAFQTKSGDPASFNHNTRIHSLEIRGFPDHGIDVPVRGIPLRIHDIFFRHFGGRGISYVPTGGQRVQIFHAYNCDFDDCDDGGLYIDNTNGDVDDTFYLESLKFEKRVDGGAQIRPVRLRNMRNAAVHAVACHAIDGGSVTEITDALFTIEGTSQPNLSWQGCRTSSSLGDIPIVLDEVPTPDVTVPADYMWGHYLQQRDRVVVAGSQPAVHILESDAASDEGTTEVLQQSGQLRVRAIADDGSVGDELLRGDRNGTAWSSLLLPADTRFSHRMRAAFGAFSDGDATPSVASGVHFKTANTGSTTITNLDGGADGQIVRVVFGDGNTTVDFTGTNLKGNSGVDWSPANGDHMTCVYDGTDWFCDISDNTA